MLKMHLMRGARRLAAGSQLAGRCRIRRVLDGAALQDRPFGEVAMRQISSLLFVSVIVHAAVLALLAAEPRDGNAPPGGGPSPSPPSAVAIRVAENSAQIAAVLADAEGKQPHDFPAWNVFRQAVGDGRAARALFVEMLKTEPDLCAAIGTDAHQLNDVLSRRITALDPAFLIRPPTESVRLIGPRAALGSLAAILLAASQPDITPDFNRDREIEADVSRTGASLGLLGRIAPKLNPDTEKLLKQLMTLWAIREGDPRGIPARLNIARTFKLEDAVLPLAIQIVHRREGIGAPEDRNLETPVTEYAIITVGKTRDRKNIRLLAPYLEDNRRLYMRRDSQIRDLALGYVVELNGGKASDYRMKLQDIDRVFPEGSSAYVFLTVEDRNVGFTRCVKNYKELGLDKPPHFAPATPHHFVFTPEEAENGERPARLTATPDGKIRLDMAGNKARLIDVATGKMIGNELDAGTCSYHDLPEKLTFTCSSFSPDGKFVVTGSKFYRPSQNRDEVPANLGHVQVWDATTGEQLDEQHEPGGSRRDVGSVRSVIFGKDSSTIYYRAERPSWDIS
jgi:hypothetical protein